MYVNQTSINFPSLPTSPILPGRQSTNIIFNTSLNESHPLSRKEKRKIQNIHKKQQKYVRTESNGQNLINSLKNALWSGIQSSLNVGYQYGLQAYNLINRGATSLDHYISKIINFNLPVVQAKTQQLWQTAFTQNALQSGAKERIELSNKNFEIIDIQKITIPTHESHRIVGWDQGAIASAHEKRLFSTEFGPCLAILAQGFEENAEKPSYMALHHVFLNPGKFSSTLKELSQKINSGNIKIYISGGQATTQEYLFSITRIIELFNLQHTNINTEIVANTFGISDIGRVYKCTKTKLYPESCGIKYVGFDDEMRPYQIIDISQNHNPKEIESFAWENEPIF